MIFELLAETIGDMALTAAMRKRRWVRRLVYGTLLLVLALAVGFVAGWL